jgi:polar amino acid transport system substrate-binding protein
MPNITRRSLAAAGMATTLLAALVACGSTNAGGPAKSAAPKYELVQDGVITAATNLQPPFSMTDASGNRTGFAIDLMNEAAKRLHLKVEYKSTDLQGTLSGLSAGRYDVGAAGFGATPARKKQVAFTKPYYWGFTAILTMKTATQKEVTDFDGKRIGVVSGSVQEPFLAERMPKAKPVKYQDQAAMIAQLLSGGVDGMVVGGADAEEYVAKQPVRIAVSEGSLQGTAYPLRKDGDPAFLNDLDAQIDKMIEDGTWVKLYKKYFHHPVAADLLRERPELAHQVAGTDLEPTD